MNVLIQAAYGDLFLLRRPQTLASRQFGSQKLYGHTDQGLSSLTIIPIWTKAIG